MPLYPFAPELCDAPDIAACVLAAMPLLQGLSFLEVGCGNGYFCGYAHSRFAARVLGIDPDVHAIAQARQNFPNCEFRAGAPLPDERFDVVLMRSPLAPQPQVLRQNLGRLMARLRPQGLLLLLVALRPHGKAVPPVLNKQDDSSIHYHDLLCSLPNQHWRKAGSAKDKTLIAIRHRQPLVSLPPAACLNGRIGFVPHVGNAAHPA